MTAPIEEVLEPQAGEIDDKDLVLAFKRGEDGSYQAIHQRYSARVKGICGRMLDHPQDAEEASQETFMRVYTALPNFNGRYQLGAWMSRIATNVCLDLLRSRTRRPSDATDHETLAALPGAATDETPEELLLAATERKRVRAVLAELPPMHRAALALREFECMSYADIAIALGMTEPQVKALIHRARRSFKKHWAPGLAAFLPWKLLARLRKFSSHYDTPTQFADVAASGSNIAASCSSVLHQCGQIVSERVASTMTAIVVGTAAVGAAIAPSGHVDPKPRFIENAQIQAEADLVPLGKSKMELVKPKREKRVVAAAENEEPTTEPQPAPTTSPPPEEPAPSQSTPPDDGKSSEKSPSNPAPPPLYTYFGWERGQPVPRAEATSHSTAVDCTAQRLSHRVDTLISDGAFSYRAIFEVVAGASTGRLSFTVFKDGGEVRYSSWGQQPVIAWTQDASRARLEITGDYGALHGYDPDAMKLPRSGQFHATLTLDCATQTVVTEGAGFTAQ